MEEKLNGFFRFYEDGFEETKPMYEYIIGALAECKGKDGKPVIPEKYTKDEFSEKLEVDKILENIIKECRRLDLKEVERTGGNVKESNIGLQGLFTSLGYTEENLGKEGLEEVYKKIGNMALKNLPQKLPQDDKLKRSLIEAKAFLGELAAGPYFPRLTCTSASHFMSIGSIMQIGCSQGKTSVVAMTTYEQLMMGKKVFSTSSAPGLVPENYDEARKFYEKMGIEEEFCSISQNMDDKTEHIVVFHQMKEGDPSLKYEIRADGQIYVETEVPDPEKPGETKTKMLPKKFGKEELESLGLELNQDGTYDFQASVKKMMREKGIIMGDTITLGKYQNLMPKRDENGVIPDSFLIVDEADAELLDTQPQEILGEKYGEDEVAKRWEDRKRAKEAIEGFNGSAQELEKYAKELKIPLDFIVDAYEAKKIDKRDGNGEPINYQVKDGKIFVLNPNTNVMIPASQGLSQAIIANDSKLAEQHNQFEEYEVLGETDIPKLFSNFETVSLMSGTMEDKGLSEYSTEEQKNLYKEAREIFLTRCGNGVKTSARKGVIDWKLVTPKTRTERGNVIVGLDGIERKEGEKEEIFTKPIDPGSIKDWRQYIQDNKETLEDNWRMAVKEEAEIRSNAGQPVMISVYGDRNPAYEGVQTYTDKNQIGSKENGTEDHKIKDDTCMFTNDGKGEVACFDDFYGRGYTFKFIERKNGEVVKNEKGKPQKIKDGGHVLITALPQNSRNLEQFLFRVARGGDAGSSSMIISPADPVLMNYLEKLENEQGKDAANQYFEDVMTGEKNIMEMVADIYPELTVELFKEKASQIEAIKVYEDSLKVAKSRMLEIGKAGKYEEKTNNLLLEFEKEYRKQMVIQAKLNRQTGIDEEGAKKNLDILMKNTVKSLVSSGKFKNAAEIVAVLPIGLSKEELEDIIPDKNLLEDVINLDAKVNRYIDKKNRPKDEIIKEEITEEKKERDVQSEILEATKEDTEYNFSEAEKALASIQEVKVTSKQQTKDEQEVSPIEGR